MLKTIDLMGFFWPDAALPMNVDTDYPDSTGFSGKMTSH
jgi:hypothetical protein